jgi:GAF domain-containing protein
MIQDVLTHRPINSDYHSSYPLNRIIAVASSTLSLREILDRICEELAQSTGALCSAFALIDPTGVQLNIYADYHCAGRPSCHDGTPLIRNNQLFNKIMADQAPIIVEPDPFEPFTTFSRPLTVSG